MSHYREFKDSWLHESTFGSSSISQSTNTYLWGVLEGKQGMPQPRTRARYGGVPSGKQEPTSMWKDPFESLGSLVFVLQNAIPLWMFLGKSVTTGPVSEIYTHTLTPLSVASGPLGSNPSFTIHHEAHSATSPDLAVQYLGSKMFNIQLSIGHYDLADVTPVLVAKTDWIVRQMQKMAWVLDNNPTLPATANAAAYKWPDTTLTWDKGGGGELVLTGLASVRLNMFFTINPVLSHWWSGATYMGHWPYTFREGSRKTYQILLEFLPQGYDLLDDLLDVTNQVDVELEFVRVATDDQLTITLGDCSVFEHDVSTPKPDEVLEEGVKIVGRSMSVVVKDKLAGSLYGE